VKQKAMPEAREMLVLRSSDGIEYTLPMEAAKLAELVRDSLPDEADEGPPGDMKKVDVMRVSSECLANVVAFLKHHDKEPMKEIPTPLGGNAFDEVSTYEYKDRKIARSTAEVVKHVLVVLYRIHAYTRIIIFCVIQIMTQEWYASFVSSDNMSQDMLFEILTAANYMGIKELLDLACLKVTFQLSGKSAEDIRVILNLPQLTQEEEEEARQTHPWIFEDPYNNP
jgi:S-phase kinase-associated protein 1